ncbi:Ribonuclease 3 [Thermoflexales bacterium]|nr:Ribonuclease 3 [Thermoflexales bacterium]
MLPTFKNSALLTRALTHRSYLNEHPEVEPEDNERLEFLGDAVLDFVVANWLFRQYPDFNEGRLTSIRAAVVRAEKLSELANQIGLGDHLRLGKGELGSGGRARQTLLADAFEAVLGALYLDQGMRAVQRWLAPLIRDEVETIVAAQGDRDAKSALQEWSQALRRITPHYRTMDEAGPDHAKQFTVAAFIGNEEVGRGKGPSKQIAAQAAAADALQQLTIPPEAES